MRYFMVSFLWPIILSTALGIVPGNLNQDNIVDVNDLVLLCQQWLDPNEFLNENIDHQGLVDFSDFTFFARYWLVQQQPDVQEMTFIPGGTFQMGDSFNEGNTWEQPVHSVTVDSFYMGRHEVTNQQYCDFLNSALGQGLITVTSNVVYQAGSGCPYCDTYQSSTNSQINWNGSVFEVRSKSGRNMANDPMVHVNWYGAAAYCNWRSQQEGRQPCYNLSTWKCDLSKNGYHLPTEAQWEYAARGGLSGQRFPWGDTISQTQANFYSSTFYSYDVSPNKNQYHPLWNDGNYPFTSPVSFFDGRLKYKADYNWAGSLSSYQTANGVNGYGLYDMAGNICERCNDWFDETYYSSSPSSNPTGPIMGMGRVIRGGGWDAYAYGCRVAYRYSWIPGQCYATIGFRISLD